eukprot:10810682-Karenia_brevis.AAC.1
MGNTWVLLRLRCAQTNLSDMTTDVLRRYSDFLIRPRVYNMRMPERVSYRVPHNIILGCRLKI